MGNSFCGLSPTTPTPPLLEGAGACRSLPLTLRGERKSSKWPTGELDTFSLGLTQGPEQGHTNRREEVMAAWEVHTHSKILLREKVHVSVYTFQMGSLMKDNQKRVYFDSIKGRWLKKWKYLGPNNWSIISSYLVHRRALRLITETLIIIHLSPESVSNANLVKITKHLFFSLFLRIFQKVDITVDEICRVWYSFINIDCFKRFFCHLNI